MFDAHVAHLARSARLTSGTVTLLPGWLAERALLDCSGLWLSAYSLAVCYLQGKGIRALP
jgi:hypothetical protein